MRRLVLVVCVLVALAGASAVGSTAAAPPALSGNSVSQAAQLLGRLAAIVQRDQRSCGKMASDIKALEVANRATIHRLNSTGANLTKMQSLLIAGQYPAYAHQIAQSVTIFTQGLARCYGNPAMSSALSSLGR